MQTNIEALKIELIQWLSVIDDAALIDKIAELKNNSESDWWNEISEAERASIDQGLADADAGKLTSNSEARTIYEKWL